MTVFLYTLLIFAFFSWSFAPFTSPHPPFRATTPAPPPLPTLKQIVRVVSQIIYFTLALFYFRAFFCLHCYRWVLLPLCNFFTRFYFLILFLFLFHLLLFCLPSLQLLFSLLLPIMRKINVLYRDQSQMKVCQGYGPQNYNCMGERLRLRLNVCVCLGKLVLFRTQADCLSECWHAVCVCVCKCAFVLKKMVENAFATTFIAYFQGRHINCSFC